jgi:hypothetical protein
MRMAWWLGHGIACTREAWEAVSASITRCEGYDVEDLRYCGHRVGARGSKAKIYAVILDFGPWDSWKEEI